MAQPRQPAGTPTGGRFAGVVHAEADGVLADPGTGDDFDSLVDEWIAWRAGHDALELRVALGRPVDGDQLAESQARGLELADRFALSGGPGPGQGEIEAAQRDDQASSTSVVLTDGTTAEAVDSPAVQRGEFFDAVVDRDGTVYRRWNPAELADEHFPWESHAMRFQASRPLTDEELNHIAGAVGYGYRVTIDGELGQRPLRDSPYSFTIFADATKSRRSDLAAAFEDFPEELQKMVTEGSPVRTTNRAGVGTKGTRLIEGLGPNAPQLVVYYAD